MAIEITQLEQSLLNKRKTDLRTAYNSKLGELAALVPDYTRRDSYRDRLIAIFDEQDLDEEYNRALLNAAWLDLEIAICDGLDEATRVALGIEDLCT